MQLFAQRRSYSKKRSDSFVLFLSQAVYIAPLKALVRERMDDWKVRFQQKLGRRYEVTCRQTLTVEFVAYWRFSTLSELVDV